MRFGGFRLGAVLVPLLVATIPVGVLLWYGMVRIPAHEAYLNERNLRLLTMLSGPIKAKVDSFDGALEHAVQSFPTSGVEGLKKFQQAVQMFAPDLDVLALTVKGEPQREVAPEITEMLRDASDPPRVRIERNEGRYYLRLAAGFDGSKVRLLAEANLDAVVMPFLRGNPEFAAVLLTTEDGEVIVQKSPVGLSLARLDSVIDVRRNTTPAKDQTAPPASFSSLSQFSNMAPVSIGEVSYKLYMQPVTLSLLSLKGAPKERHSEQWVLCGLVRTERFRAESSSISYPVLLWFSALLAVLTLAIPFVKLRAIGARERLRANDLGWVTAATFTAIGLLTFVVLDICTFDWQVGRAVDSRLTGVGSHLVANVTAEVDRIDRQAKAFERENNRDRNVFVDVSRELERTRASFPRIDVDPKRGVACNPEPACRTDLATELLADQDRNPYPFFDLATWAGEDGWQRMRMTPGRGLRPFINIFDEHLPYARAVRAAWQVPRATPATGVDVLLSPNTGEPLTVFWRTGEASGVKWVQSLAMASLVSLERPILPKGVSFAVVDKDWQVLFHSVRNRRLKENLLKECEDDPGLQSALRGSDPRLLSARYLGRPNRFYVAPLELPGFSDPGWRLAVFQDAEIIDTLDLETLTIACWLFGLYSGVVALAAALIHAMAREDRKKWFWPDPGKTPAYRLAWVINGLAIVVFVLVFVTASTRTPALLAATAALAAAAAVATYRIVAAGKTDSGSAARFACWPSFVAARATFLFVVAGLPAIACFQAAYSFEMTLLAASENAQRRVDAHDLADRMAKAAGPLRITSERALDILETFKSRRRVLVPDNTFTPLWPGVEGAAERTAGAGTLTALLAWMHRPYNEVANALGTAGRAGSAKTQATALTASLLVGIIGLLLAVCCAFVQWLIRPVFVFDAVAPPLPTGAADALSPRLLVVGPPGSGKSTSLAADPDFRIFDIATLAYLERRKQSVGVAFDRRRAAVAVAGRAAAASFGAFWDDSPAASSPPPAAPAAGGWAGTFDYSTLPRVLGIDHLDHRLEERDFAAQTLKFVERAIYRERCRIRIVSDRDPLACLRESGASAADLDRWARVLRSFRKETVGIGRQAGFTPAPSDAMQATLDECREIPGLERIATDVLRDLPASVSVDDALAAFGSAASPYYEALWHSCAIDERLALHQLAEEGLVNPQNQAVVRHLMRAGLIVRDPVVRIMNRTFRDFVRQAPSPDQIMAWESRGVQVPWGSIEVAMMTVVVGLAGLLVITQEQLLNAWIGFVPTLVPTVQTLWKAFVAVRPVTKGPVSV